MLYLFVMYENLMYYIFAIEIMSFIKAGIHYTNFAQIFAPICSLKASTLVAKSQSQSADFRQSELTDFKENHVVYVGH